MGRERVGHRDQGSFVDAKGRVTLHLLRTMFPPICCRCGEPTEECRQYSVDVDRSWLATIIWLFFSVCFGWFVALAGMPHAETITFDVPFCSSCRRAIKAKGLRTGLMGVGATLGLAVIAALVAWLALGPEPALGIAIVAAPILLVSYFIGQLLGRSEEPINIKLLKGRARRVRISCRQQRFRDGLVGLARRLHLEPLEAMPSPGDVVLARLGNSPYFCLGRAGTFARTGFRIEFLDGGASEVLLDDLRKDTIATESEIEVIDEATGQWNPAVVAERFFDRIKVKQQKKAGSVALGAIRVHELLEESEASDPLFR